MIFTILTLFPKQVQDFLSESIIGNAMRKGAIDLRCVDIRHFSKDPHKRVDDTLYGGGKGMLLTCDPVFESWNYALTSEPMRAHTIFLSPRGSVLDQKKALELSQFDHLILLCGHYEGIDQRVVDRVADEEISIGDYILTGGEVAACVLVECISRFIHGVLPHPSAFEDESHMNGVLESAHYTKPEEWNGRVVPDVLRSGNHKNIEEWRRLEGLYDTYKNRPDLLEKRSLTPKEWHYIVQKENVRHPIELQIGTLSAPTLDSSN